LKAIVENYAAGTAFDIHVDADGLLRHGSRLTWMDAAVGNTPATPRMGKAVEVQALWYNALRTVELLANKFGEKKEAEEYARMAETTKKSFTEKFWNARNSCLFDVVNADGRDDSSRPNQILAVSLDFSMLDNEKNERIVDFVQRELLTPYGLGTLARTDPRYVGIYAGDRGIRDNAYHNGTAWPWLIGPFATAFLRTKGYSELRRKYVWNAILAPLVTTQLLRAGLGSLNEIFDGDPPNNPRGCIAQAWSVAEALRVYVEDLMQVRPEYETEILSGAR
jgi:predicted glycogen debranching enzyme